MSTKVLPVKVGDIVSLQINNLNHEGEGVGRCQGLAVFVPFTVPGEEVQARIVQTKKNFARAEVTQLVKESDLRTQPRCNSYGKCGGCQLQHIDYQQQVELKRQRVEAALLRIGKLEGVEILPVLGMEQPWAYRNKVHFKVEQKQGRFGDAQPQGHLGDKHSNGPIWDGHSQGQLYLGYFGTAEDTNIAVRKALVKLEQCSLIDAELNQVAKAVEELLKIYSPAEVKNIFQHVVIRKSFLTGGIMAVIVTSRENWPQEVEFATKLRSRCSSVCSVIRSIKELNSSVVMGEKSYVLAGKAVLLDQLSLEGACSNLEGIGAKLEGAGNNLVSIQFNISPESFFQVNPVQTERLYAQVLQFAQLSGRETVIDAFCGTGTIALFLAKQAAKVIGIEIVPEAVRDAEENARLNGITNTEFLVGKTEELLPKLYRQGLRPNVIVLDPPRRGCERSALEAVGAMQPDKLVYVSCDPASLARDLSILDGLGYRTVVVQPVDMFPQTGHVECVVSIQRVE